MSDPSTPADASEVALCELCTSADATVLVEVPMCGVRPKYAVCDACVPELGAYVETVEAL